MYGVPNVIPITQYTLTPIAYTIINILLWFRAFIVIYLRYTSYICIRIYSRTTLPDYILYLWHILGTHDNNNIIWKNVHV